MKLLEVANTMSSALPMVLMVAMAFPGSGPERVSGEVERGLDLSGEWKGTITYEDKQTQNIIFDGRKLITSSWSRIGFISWDMKDEGCGKFRVVFFDEDHLGIYEWRGDTVVLCIRPVAKGRPTSFRVGDGQHLLILRRVKPGK